MTMLTKACGRDGTMDVVPSQTMNMGRPNTLPFRQHCIPDFVAQKPGNAKARMTRGEYDGKHMNQTAQA
jgi:hypothetical protein